jgi:hypothetical protein
LTCLCLRGSRNESVKKVGTEGLKRIQSRNFFLFLLHHLHARPFSIIASAIEPYDYKLFFLEKSSAGKVKMPAVLEAIEISAEKASNLIK